MVRATCQMKIAIDIVSIALNLGNDLSRTPTSEYWDTVMGDRA